MLLLSYRNEHSNEHSFGANETIMSSISSIIMIVRGGRLRRRMATIRHRQTTTRRLSRTDARLLIDFYFMDTEPIKANEILVPAERCVHIRLDEPEQLGGFVISFDTPYGARPVGCSGRRAIQQDVPHDSQYRPDDHNGFSPAGIAIRKSIGAGGGDQRRALLSFWACLRNGTPQKEIDY